MTASYRDLLRSGELRRRAGTAFAMQSPCRLCPRECGALRAAAEAGLCGSGTVARVYRAAPHFGEEPPLSGRRGSGAVFFSGCPLRCSYCQNHRFSQEGEGISVTVQRLAAIFLELEEEGCHNLNLVTSTHYLPQILLALERAGPLRGEK